MSDTKHDQVLSQIFAHPIAHNLEWRELIGALKSIGTMEEVSNGKYHFSRNGRTITFEEPGAKDVGEEEILRLRTFLRETDTVVPKADASHEAIVVATHDDVSVYLREGTLEASHLEFKPEDPRGFRRHLHHKGQEKDHPLQQEERGYYDAVADALAGIERTVLISNGTGSSSAGDLFRRELTERHPKVAEKIVFELKLDLEAMTEPELIAAGTNALSAQKTNPNSRA